MLLERLPRASQYREAQVSDPEWAAAVIDMPESESTSPAWSAFSPEVEVLTLVADLLQHVNANVIALGGGDSSRPKPLSRPVTALDKARKAARTARYDSLVSEVEAAMVRYTQLHPEGE